MVKEMEREREESESLLQTQVKDLQERRNEGEKQLIQMERELMKTKEVLYYSREGRREEMKES